MVNVTLDPVINGEKCDSNHEYCNNISKNISLYIDSNNSNIPPVLLHRYIYIVCTNIFCWTVDYDRNINFLIFIFKNCKLDIDDIIKIKDNPELIEIMIKNNKDYDFIRKLPQSDNNLLKYIEQLLKNENITEETLKICFNVAVKKKFILSINKILDNKFIINDSKLFDDIIFNLLSISIQDNNNIENVETILKKCINNGATIQNNTSIILINKIMSDNSIISYDNIESYDKYERNKKYRSYDSYNYYNKCENFFPIMSFLYTNGSTISIGDILKLKKKIRYKYLSETINFINNENKVKITREEFKTICELSIKLSNINNVKIYFDDEEIQEIIYSHNISYPIKYVYNINTLRNECKYNKKTLGDIKKILKTVKPDDICMKNAFLAMNIPLIKLLRENYGIPITEEYIYIIAKKYNNYKLNTILTEYEKVHKPAVLNLENNLIDDEDEDVDDKDDNEDLDKDIM